MASIIKAADAARATTAAAFHLSELSRSATELRPVEALRSDGAPNGSGRQSDASHRAADDDARAAALAAAELVFSERVEEQLTPLVGALADGLAQIQLARSEWLAHCERTAIGVAVAIAERVIRRQLDHRPEITVALVREALELAAGSGDVQVHLHPEDFETLSREAKRLAAELPRLGHVDVVPDPAITKGGCRVDTCFGTIDQQVEAQLARIEQELT